jgi:hypothetical protein
VVLSMAVSQTRRRKTLQTDPRTFIRQSRV